MAEPIEDNVTDLSGDETMGQRARGAAKAVAGAVTGHPYVTAAVGATAVAAVAGAAYGATRSSDGPADGEIGSHPEPGDPQPNATEVTATRR